MTLHRSSSHLSPVSCLILSQTVRVTACRDGERVLLPAPVPALPFLPVDWHGMVQMPIGYGMIETIGGLDFNCTGGLGGPPPYLACENGKGQQPPHSEADTGGEFIAA